MLERIKWWLSRRSRESSMQREVEAHIACEAEEQIDRGLDPAAAREAVQRYFSVPAGALPEAFSGIASVYPVFEVIAQ
jgi:hypothetical protein